MEAEAKLVLARHAESAYNEGKKMRRENDIYRAFRSAFDREFQNGKGVLSPETIDLARQLQEAHIATTGDHNTPLTERGYQQAVEVGTRLHERISEPHVIFVSPYQRTVETMEGMMEGWPVLRKAKVIKEELIREREHGVVIASPEWRVALAANAEQLRLRGLNDQYWYRFPSGESLPDARLRDRIWRQDLRARYADKRAMAVTHHEFILADVANHFGWDDKGYFSLDTEQRRPANASITIYRASDDIETDYLSLDMEKDYGIVLYKE